MKKIKSVEILDMIYEDMKIDKFLIKYKILRTHIGYLDNVVLGKNNNIPNIIIHNYYYLENKENFNLAWESLNTQLEILIKIIRIWLLNNHYDN
ncbi:hypothetical protein [Spiroplasma endosymbiont of Monopis laevigella]|uniref:hypothetical protein n=1 Tax=Spiroplasma endosymbiont of Monopis laevigella TaxID=3066312 RepID=UPI0030CCB002